VRQTSDAHHRLTFPPYRGGGIINKTLRSNHEFLAGNSEQVVKVRLFGDGSHLLLMVKITLRDQNQDLEM